MRRPLPPPLPVVLCLAVLAGCSATADRVPVATTTSAPTTSSTPVVPTSTPAAAPAPEVAVVVVPYRVERRTTDAATVGFEEVVVTTLEDPRGWQRAGFDLVHQRDAPHLIVLAEGPEVDRLCLPYETYGRYSCQIGPVVALNADRWREATSKWTGDLASYRQMLVNHEVGHLLGQHHLRCPRPGVPAPIMVQQSTELRGCLPNPWPLDDEIARAARHDLPLAPPFERVPAPEP